MSLRRLIALAAGALAVAAPAAAGAQATPARAFGETSPAARGLMVTFTDVPGAAAAAARLRGLGEVTPLAPGAGVWRLAPARRAGIRDAVLRRTRVRAAEWPLVRRSAERTAPASPLAPIPLAPLTDTQSGGQWGLQHDGWDPQLVGREPRPIIAVLDGGLDLQHPEWSGANAAVIVAPHSVIPGRNPLNVDDWGRTGHGTHVAGVAAAPANGIGVVGVAPASAQSRLMPVQVASRDGEFLDEDMIAGIRWAVRNGARVINISAGGPGDTYAFQRVVYWATRHGALIVAAVGNEGDGENKLLYPAAYRRVLGVGAQCGPDRTPDCRTPLGVAAFSQHNRSVDIIAPGVDILSTVPREVADDEVAPGYAFRDGTSMAAPYVAGVAALVQAANGNALTPYQVARQLEVTARDVGPKGRDDRSGWGVIDVARAVTTPVPPDDGGEVNDDVAYLGNATDLSSATAPLVLEADVDQQDDPHDVYAVRVRRGQRVRVELTAPAGRLELSLWGPRTTTVSTRVAGNAARNLLALSRRPGKRQVAVVRAARDGRVYVDVRAARGTTGYTLRVRRQR
ncbi:MAG: S8 family serine peptidase [Thermoleophilia bacterium]|nr:S8 family serine peptidase [Thermoleophilia bacterium]